MMTLTLETAEGVIHNLAIGEDGDVLSTLDKFLKKNKLDLFQVRKLSMACAQEESTRCRVARSAIAATRFFTDQQA